MRKRLLFIVNLLTIVLSIFCQPLQIFADWGDLDTSFGFQGAAVDQITGHAPRNVAIQPDGKILVTGYKTTPFGGEGFFLRRYLSDGQLDTAFGTNGAAIGPESNFLRTLYRGERIAVQANGRIAVVGTANGYYAVWQFSASGRRDDSFGRDGLRILNRYPINDNTSPELNIQSGKLLVTIRKMVAGDARVALLRLTTSGTNDGTFGNSGEALTDLLGYAGWGTFVEPDEKITIGGQRFGTANKVLERKLSNGQTDLSFSPTLSPTLGFVGPGLVRLANDKYTLRVGNLASNGTVTFMLDKFSSAGVSEGGVGLHNGPYSERCPDLFANQNDGKLVVSIGEFIFRLSSDFATFETYNCTNIDGVTSYHAAIQSDDKMVAAGSYNNYLILVRVLPN